MEQVIAKLDAIIERLDRLEERVANVEVIQDLAQEGLFEDMPLEGYPEISPADWPADKVDALLADILGPSISTQKEERAKEGNVIQLFPQS